MGFKYTGRVCVECGGQRRDAVLDWDDALPEKDFELAIHHSRRADLSLCLGTSLQVGLLCVRPARLKTMLRRFALRAIYPFARCARMVREGVFTYSATDFTRAHNVQARHPGDSW